MTPKLSATALPVKGLPTPIYWLALGSFAIGTESFMIAPLMPSLAKDLAVTVEAVGQLVTVFALAYAISSPILTALTGAVDRRRMLLLSMAAFALANVFAWTASGYWALMGARILLALSAGLYVPGAHALASALVTPNKRGRALAVVNGGITIAIALGVPLGAFIGHSLGWRMTFAGVAALSVVAVGGLSIGLPRDIGVGIAVATLRERIAVVKQPAILLGLLVTTLWATGAYTVYTYLALLLTTIAGLADAQISMVLFLWGISAAIGVFLGGHLNDRSGHRSVIVPSLILLTLAFISLSVMTALLSHSTALLPMLAAVILWGLSAWAFYPAQQARLLEIAGLKFAPIVLSLNASFMYTGFSVGAALGGLTIARGSAADLGWVGGICEILALILILAMPPANKQVLIVPEF